MPILLAMSMELMEWSNKRKKAYAKATGMFVRKPNVIDESPETIAVAVIKSR